MFKWQSTEVKLQSCINKSSLFKLNCSNLIFLSNTIFISKTPCPRISWHASNTSTCSLHSEFAPWRLLVNSFNGVHPFLGKFPELRKSDCQLGDVWPHWTTQIPLDSFHEIQYLSICQKSVKKTQVYLQSYTNNRYFTLRHMYIYDILLNYYETQKCFRKCCRENKNTLCHLWDNMENMVQPVWPHMTMQYSLYASYIGWYTM